MFKLMVLFVISWILGAIVVFVPQAFASHTDIEIKIPSVGSSTYCTTTHSCFQPEKVVIHLGSKITWTNEDTIPHTITSMDFENGPDGLYDTSLKAGQKFSFTYKDPGVYYYLCTIHPWMRGVIDAEKRSFSGNDSTTPIRVKMDASSYKVGDTVVITGSVGNPENTASIKLRILDPDQRLVVSDNFSAEKYGHFSKTYAASGPQWEASGTYTLIVQDAKGQSAEATFSFMGVGGSIPNPPKDTSKEKTNQNFNASKQKIVSDSKLAKEKAKSDAKTTKDKAKTEVKQAKKLEELKRKTLEKVRGKASGK